MISTLKFDIVQSIQNQALKDIQLYNDYLFSLYLFSYWAQFIIYKKFCKEKARTNKINTIHLERDIYLVFDKQWKIKCYKDI